MIRRIAFILLAFNLLLSPLLADNDGLTDADLKELVTSYLKYREARRIVELIKLDIAELEDRISNPERADELIKQTTFDIGGETEGITESLTTPSKLLLDAKKRLVEYEKNLARAKIRFLANQNRALWTLRSSKGYSITKGKMLLNDYIKSAVSSLTQRQRAVLYEDLAKDLKRPNVEVDLGSVAGGPEEIVRGREGVIRATTLAERAFDAFIKASREVKQLETLIKK